MYGPRCFEIERRLRSELDIPVFQYDQHGTAIVVLAALLNALKVVGKQAEQITPVIVGAGAAGLGCADILLAHGIGDVIVCNRRGALYAGAQRLDPDRAALTEHTNKRRRHGTADEVLEGADLLLGVSGPGAGTPAAVRRIVPKAIVFAMANPVPEVHPEEIRGEATIIATGRSDYPNQINNVLAFPGVFKGALEVRARTINGEEMTVYADRSAGYVGGRRLADARIPGNLRRTVPHVLSRAHDRSRDRHPVVSMRLSAEISRTSGLNPSPMPVPTGTLRQASPVSSRKTVILWPSDVIQ